MKHIKIISLIICILLLTSLFGCSDSKIINGKRYETYGLINQDEIKEDNIRYKVCWGNVIWGAILFESVIGPIYFFGFDLFEPVEAK